MINCIYLHIPFCEKKCKYCAFCSFKPSGKENEYINSLIKEINEFYKGNKLKTIYFGGGTPSLLKSDDVKKILDQFNYDKNTEITFEFNPDNVNIKELRALKSLGINRLSLGVQSFDDDLLIEIGRNHNKSDVLNAIKVFIDAGFDNFSIDLMYGLPNQNIETWNKTLDTTLSYNIPHISLYGLKIEQGTYYSKFTPNNLPDMDMQAKMYELAIEKLSEKYLHYEFSNFALSEKYYSKHNLCYWKRENYFGFGLSAAGFIENKRYTNTQNFKNYITDPISKDYEELTFEQIIEEEIFLGLRVSSGINFQEINKKYNIDIFKKYKNLFEKFLNEGFMEKTKFGVKLTVKGILVSNEILCEFIDV